MSEISLAQTADNRQRAAFAAFTRLTAADPGLAADTFQLYVQNTNAPDGTEAPAVSPEQRAALGTIATYFRLEADQYTSFADAEIELESAPARDAWQMLNLAGKTNPETEARAKLRWRQQRIRSYLMRCLSASHPEQLPEPEPERKAA